LNTIDLAAYRELQQTAGADFVVELVDTFLEEGPVMLAELRSAHAAADADRFRRAAHSLKSNCRTFGLSALGDLARSLELRGIADPAFDAATLDAVDAAYAHVAAALKELARG
jgi:histidine phosphotransfer protein HptB